MDHDRRAKGGRVMHAPWLGSRKVAFVPVINRQVDAGVPPGFSDSVMRRVLGDVDPVTQVDRGLRRYLSTVSYGRATLTAEVTDPVEAVNPDTMGAALRSIPAGHDFDACCAVLPSAGPDRTGFAWWHADDVNGFQNFARVNLDEGLGVWAMEIVHCLGDFADLYNTNPHLTGFDNMACSCGTHPTVHTKVHLSWLPESTVATKSTPGGQSFDLHAVGLPQPAPQGRRMAVRIPGRDGGNPYMVEARLHSDQYDGPSFASSGVPSEGVIVYEVAGKTEVYLRTPTALGAGDTFTAPGDDRLEVFVSDELVDGFTVTVTIPLAADERTVPSVRFLAPGHAAEHVRQADLEPAFTGVPEDSGTFVFDQSPGAHTIVRRGSTVTMRLRQGQLP